MPIASPTDTSSPTGDSEAREKSSAARKRTHLTPFDSERGRKAAQARWARQKERDSVSELDRLTALARAGVVAARVLDARTQMAVLQAQANKAAEGHVQSARFVMDWLVKLGSSHQDDADVESLDPATMTPAQRAQLRARILREAMALEETPANEEIP